MGCQGILDRIGNRLASVEIKRKENGLLKKCGPRSSWAIEKFLFKFWIKDLSLNKIVLNIFKLNLNGVQTRINSNKLFDDFSNLEVSKLV
jgi:hypothetical protein